MLRFIQILTILWATTAVAQVHVEMHDTTVQRGKQLVPVYATLTAQAGDSVCLNLRFDPNMLDIYDVAIPIFGTSNLQFTVDLLEYRKAELHVNFVTSGMNIQLAPLLLLSVEVLAGADSITVIEPLSICRNSVPVTTPILRNATVHVLDAIPVVDTAIEYLNSAFPHPSVAPSFMYFTMSKGSVHFTLYNELGREILDEVVADVEPGLHTFFFKSEDYQTLCDAPYYLRMITVIGVYSQQFVVEH